MYKQHKTEWKPVKVGDKFGPSWATHWFRVELTLPEEFVNKVTRVESFFFDRPQPIWMFK